MNKDIEYNEKENHMRSLFDLWSSFETSLDTTTEHNSRTSALASGFCCSSPVADEDLLEVLLDSGILSLGSVVHMHIRSRQKRLKCRSRKVKPPWSHRTVAALYVFFGGWSFLGVFGTAACLCLVCVVCVCSL